MSVEILPYELYSDAPGILLNKPEWEAANAAHPASFDFGLPPRNWPTKFQGPDSITHIDPSERSKIYVSAQDTNAQMYHSDAGSDIHRPDIARVLAEKKFRWRANGIPEDGVRLIHQKDGRVYLNFSTRTFIGYGELPDRDADYAPLTFDEREAFGGWQWVADQYSLKTQLQVGDIEWVNNLHHQHARRGFSEDLANPRHLLRVWLRDSEHSPEIPSDIQNKFDAMFSEEPDFYPVDEIEEDTKRRDTGIFTGACKPETAEERLQNGGITATNVQVVR
ncbi:hypothetical protein G7Z17_g3146 [Cylindrodendrum hubeiense]|uniref:TauD/TfdA-like domain-containing protein n=1 Tax=Cylindrodendrum hubeiense TaxID=595255 RepID=A0A9P5HCY9_9HYPO|nr:hypothetical protein G7Z17_g3146 [Cylindrodendrum hubeiense]